MSHGALAECRGWVNAGGILTEPSEPADGTVELGFRVANCSQISATAVPYGVGSELVHRDKQEMQKKKNSGKDGALGPWWHFVLCTRHRSVDQSTHTLCCFHPAATAV